MSMVLAILRRYLLSRVRFSSDNVTPVKTATVSSDVKFGAAKEHAKRLTPYQYMIVLFEVCA